MFSLKMEMLDLLLLKAEGNEDARQPHGVVSEKYASTEFHASYIKTGQQTQ